MKIAPKEQLLFSHNIFNISLTSGIKLHIHLWNVVCWFIFPQIWYVDVRISQVFQRVHRTSRIDCTSEDEGEVLALVKPGLSPQQFYCWPFQHGISVDVALHLFFVFSEVGSSVAKVSCIWRHRGVQLILANSKARSSSLLADKGRGGIFFISSVSSLSFLFLFLLCPSLSSHLLSILSIFSLSLGDDTKWPKGLTCR